ncbi:DUF349 domain-containing protein [Modestobacter sp. VKM Ac-2986]|uniref:DUF349 domain-containing protein n=1 Tax=Modestobacter sp. VKM Ac-2986 TaxID=3004140 RepID=UPI0022AB623F|nr:DUF349 domain-containing protein [Modestobacter sp. VKM Ac-2986]MCZ2831101.1 DUF349 domain-containing protein [Modestobacter sp. VKM Ac-2986]
MSSTENTGDRTQQPATAPEEQPETAMLEVAPVDEGPLGATPDAALPEADDPGPVAEQPASTEVTRETAAPDTDTAPPVDTDAPAPAVEDVAVTELAPVDEGPLGATPDAAEPQDAPAARARSGRAPSDVPSVVPAAPASDPAAWGRVDEDGTVYVKTAGGERSVGSWQAGAPAEGLAHYGRRFDDLATEVTLLEARLAAHTGNPGEIRTKAQELADTIPLAQAVGDLDSLSARARAMVSMADTAVAANRAEKAAQRAVQVQRKEALAAEAEDIAENSSQWKAAGDRLKAIVEEWKTIKGIDRKTDEALWQRFAAARDAFGRRRGAHFAQLDTQRAEARAAKSELIAEAERLSTSTEWGPTSAAMRALMDRWKAVPRVGRDTDDDLWKKFRGAQDVFFAARTANDQARSTDEVANQKAKEELLAEAEKIEPGKNARGAQEALRKIQERYDAIGHVPRGVMRQLEDRMRAVEEKVRGAAEAGRPRVEPENPLLTSMRAAVTKAEEQLAKAQASGNAKRIAEAQDALSTRREWLAEAQKASSRR